MDTNEGKNNNSELFLEHMHETVVNVAEKFLSLAELLQIPSHNIQQYLDVIRAVKSIQLRNFQGDFVPKETIDIGVQTEDFANLTQDAVQLMPAEDESGLFNDFEVVGNSLSEVTEQETKYFIDENSDKTASDKSSIEAINVNEAEILQANSLQVLSSDDEKTKNLNVGINKIDYDTAAEITVKDKSNTKMLNTGVQHVNSDEKDDDQDDNNSQFNKSSKTLKLDDADKQSTLQNITQESSSSELRGFKSVDNLEVIIAYSSNGSNENQECKKSIAKKYIIENITETKVLEDTNNADDLKMKESEVKTQTAPILNHVKPISYEPLPREEVTIKGNEEDVLKCIDIAETALTEKNFDKAERFLLKSERIRPTTVAKKLLEDIRMVKEAKTNVAFVENQINKKEQISNNQGHKLRENARKALSGEKFALQAMNISPRDKKTKVYLDEIRNAKEDNKITKHSDDITKNGDNKITIFEAFDLLRTANILMLNGNIEDAEKLVIKSKRIHATEAANKMLEKINRIREKNRSKQNHNLPTNRKISRDK